MGRLRIKLKRRKRIRGYRLMDVHDAPPPRSTFMQSQGVMLLDSKGALVGTGTHLAQLRRLRDLARLSEPQVRLNSVLGPVADEVARARDMLVQELQVPIEILDPKEKP
jgi:hypothetical protein